jgi:uncharacterized MAPEG superfamily protein
MTLAYWCVLAAAVLPYLCVLATGIPTKAGKARWGQGYDNVEPRMYLESLEGWRRRARAAEANGYEAFPPFAAAVIIAHLTHGPSRTIDLLAAGFVALRILHFALYVGNVPALRTLVWFAGVGAVIALFVVAA